MFIDAPGHTTYMIIDAPDAAAVAKLMLSNPQPQDYDVRVVLIAEETMAAFAPPTE